MLKLFINEYGRLRSGWRVVIFVSGFIAALMLLVTVLRAFYVVFLAVAPPLPPTRIIPDVIYRFSLLGASLGAGYLCARYLEALPWRSLGLTLHAGWFRDLLIGCVVGFVSLAIAVGIAAAGNGLKFSINNASLPALGRSLIVSVTWLFVAALAEEAVFRGYALQTFTRAQLIWFGVVSTSVAFGFAHLSNPNVVGLAFVNTVLAGVWFAIGYLRTRSLWLPLGLHWAWNWALGWFFGVPVSGATLVSNTLLRATDVGPEWLTGGNYGIEGGIAGTVAIIASTVFLWWTPWLNATPELKKLTSGENPATREPVINIRSVED
ncbi:MAG TPA: CPBP family intramembrane glutamic endopeptidase [Pyrinomonadaceae bacterium]|nr:CPBP family intramembrane glutamic endopeptidase [Pyrinomonadaceae bacterium]